MTFAALAVVPAVAVAMTMAVAATATTTTTASAASAGPAAVAGDVAHAARISENRAWLRSLPSAPEPTLHRSGLRATELGRWPVRGANQGVAVDADHFYGTGVVSLRLQALPRYDFVT